MAGSRAISIEKYAIVGRFNLLFIVIMTPEICGLRILFYWRPSSHERFAPMRNRWTGDARGESCSVGLTGCVRTTKQYFPIPFNLEVVCDAIATGVIAKKDFIGRMLEMKVLHSTSLARVGNGVTVRACAKPHERLLPLSPMVAESKCYSIDSCRNALLRFTREERRSLCRKIEVTVQRASRHWHGSEVIAELPTRLADHLRSGSRL